MKPVLVDLFCKAGGATKGYQRAGFYVVGVDIEPQPHYCGDEFFQADALTFPLGEAQAVHASPPCQGNTSLRHLTGRQYQDLLTPMRTLLERTGLPWVIENVPGAPMRPDLILCGEMFGLKVRRHRWFELSRPALMLVSPCVHAESPVGVYGHPGGRPSAAFHRESLNGATAKRYTTADWHEAMDIDWMTANELAQAIPPAYTELVGEQLMAFLKTETPGA